jgi:hypothetical protein
MAEIIDVLTPKYADCPYFNVTAPATSSVKTAVVHHTPFFFYVDGTSGNLFGRFQNRDNIRLLSAGFYIPEGFQQANTPKIATSIAANEILFEVYKSDKTTPSAPLPGLGARGVIALPFANYEMTYDIYCDMSDSTAIPLLADNDFYLKADVFFGLISMIGVPALLNTGVGDEPIKIIPFIKVLHTLPIIL